MLGCQDFCGYYEWTFHYLRRKYGLAGLKKYWTQAVAADAQRHYILAGKENGLRGLYESWFKTGVDERCEWTVALDEDRNLLRLDMRECPSKGFLTNNDLNADEDYCDHCMGWIGPALNEVGAEVVAHEHNHCGQCWWEMRMINKDYFPVETSADIRNDPRWNLGYLDRFAHQTKLPIVDSGNSIDPCDVIASWFCPFVSLVVLGDAPIARDEWPAIDPLTAVIVSGSRFADGDLPDDPPRGVIVENDSALLPKIASRFLATPPASRPMLMHAFMPRADALDFIGFSLPRPVPILPLIIRSGLYVHRPHEPGPSTCDLALMFSMALDKNVVLRGYSTQGHRIKTLSKQEFF